MCAQEKIARKVEGVLALDFDRLEREPDGPLNVREIVPTLRAMQDLVKAFSRVELERMPSRALSPLPQTLDKLTRSAGRISDFQNAGGDQHQKQQAFDSAPSSFAEMYAEPAPVVAYGLTASSDAEVARQRLEEVTQRLEAKLNEADELKQKFADERAKKPVADHANNSA